MKPFEFSEFFNLGKLIEQPYFSVNTFSEVIDHRKIANLKKL